MKAHVEHGRAKDNLFPNTMYVRLNTFRKLVLNWIRGQEHSTIVIIDKNGFAEEIMKLKQ